MAHLTLQIGAAIIVPVGPRRCARRAGGWRKRALLEAATFQPASSPAAYLLAGRVDGLKISWALTSMLERV